MRAQLSGILKVTCICHIVASNTCSVGICIYIYMYRYNSLNKRQSNNSTIFRCHAHSSEQCVNKYEEPRWNSVKDTTKYSFHLVFWKYDENNYKRVYFIALTHRGRVTYTCVSKLIIIGPDNGLAPGWRQVIIWTNIGILLIQTLGINFSEILSEIHIFSMLRNDSNFVSASMC